MASPSPPKPWERGGAAGRCPALSSTPGVTPSPATNPHTSAATAPPLTSSTISSSSSSPPALPERPSALSAVVNRTASNYSPYGASRLGTSPYGGLSSYSSPYSSPYSRFGGMGGSMYGGMGGLGGMYGGMGGYGGGMYGGMGGMGGVQGDPNDPNSLTNSFSQSTQATFQIIESIVGAFGGFAQMLESTYMATHSSFFAMISVAEQFGNLRNTLGSIFGIFTLLRWLRTLLAKITGRPPPADAMALTPAAFAAFQGLSSTSPATALLPDRSPAPTRPSKKPFIMFVLAVFGLPYLMGKLIRALARSQEEEAAKRQHLVLGPDGQPLPQQQQQPQPLDPSKLDFCRVLYDFTPDATVAGVDLAVKKGDLVAVLSKSDPVGNPSEWWRCRARDGRVGYLPSPYLEGIQRKGEAKGLITSGSQAGSRSGTMTERTTSGLGLGADGSMNEGGKEGEKGPKIEGKVADITAESFAKSQFYS